MLPVKSLLALTVVLTNRLMDDEGESWRIPINILNVISMIVAIRANLALYFEIRTHLDGMRPILKYISCRLVLSFAISQRFGLDASVRDTKDRFNILNLLLVFEMTGLAIAWFFIFSPHDPVFEHIRQGGVAPAVDSQTAEVSGAVSTQGSEPLVPLKPVGAAADTPGMAKGAEPLVPAPVGVKGGERPSSVALESTAQLEPRGDTNVAAATSSAAGAAVTASRV